MRGSGPWRGALLPLLLAALTACATPARRGVDLSEAQREAAKDDDEKRKVLEAEEPRQEEVEDEEPSTLEVGLALADALTAPEPVPSVAPPAAAPHDRRNNLSVVGTGLSYAGDVLKSQAGAGVIYGFYPESKVRVSFGGYFLDGSLGSQGEGFTDFEELSGEAAARFYLTSDHTLVGMYFQAGARAGLFHWSYANPVVVQEGGGLVEIGDDTLTTYSGFVGVGVAPLQLSRFHLGAGLNLGVRLYQGVTHEGFDNDVFATVGFQQVFVEATALF